MRSISLLAVSAVALVGLAAPAGAQEARQDFTLVNKTGYAFNEAYLAPAKSNAWEEDFLGDYQLDEGEAKKVHFNPKTKTCMWDLKVTYTIDKSSVVWRDLDLCNTERITVFYDRKTDTTSAKLE